MKSILRITIVVLIVLGIGCGLVWGFLAGRSDKTADADSDASIGTPSRVVQEAGKTVLTFDAQAQHENGIALTTLIAERRNAEAQATGVVLQLQPLLDLKTSYNTALTDIAKAGAASQASQAEYKRLVELNRGGQNISEKAVEAAQAAAESDGATLRNAQQSLAVLKDSMQLRWGAAIANWLQQGSPQLGALVAQRLYLLQVTAMGGGTWTPPAYAMVQFPDGAHASAHLVSAIPQLDPRLQAPSFLYTAAAHPGLIPGMNLSVTLPSGPARDSVVVPYSAIVWWQGNAWCYVEEAAGKFTRERVFTGNPAPTGWFVSEGISAGAQVVTKGAQTLLSEEFHSQIQADQD